MRLREIEEQDLGMLLEHRNDWSTRRWLGDTRLLCIDDQYRWYRNPGATGFWIAQTDAGADVGLARVRPVNASECEVGCDVFRQFRGLGWGSKVFGAAVEKAREMGAKRLSLWVFFENEPAVRIYRDAGFEVDAETPVQVFCRGGEIQHYVRMTSP